MRKLALISNLGGCGRTSLAACLASAFTERGQQVLVVEFDAANALGMHLGLEQAPADGWVSRLVAGQPWAAAALQNSEQIAFLPFGSLAASQLDDFTVLLSGQTRWLAERLAELLGQERTLVLLDAPPLPSPFARQALAAADFALLVLEADGRSLALLPSLIASLQEQAPDLPYAVLVNKLDSSLPLERDFLSVLQYRLGQQLLPYPVHRDESVRLAYARLLSLFEAYPQAQAVYDLSGVAGWLDAQPALQVPGAGA